MSARMSNIFSINETGHVLYTAKSNLLDWLSCLSKEVPKPAVWRKDLRHEKERKGNKAI